MPNNFPYENLNLGVHAPRFKYDRDAVDAIAKFLLEVGEMDEVTVRPSPDGRVFRVEGTHGTTTVFCGIFGRGHGEPLDPEDWMARLDAAGLLR